MPCKNFKWVVVKVDDPNLTAVKTYVKHDKARQYCLKTPNHKVMSAEYWHDKRTELKLI